MAKAQIAALEADLALTTFPNDVVQLALTIARTAESLGDSVRAIAAYQQAAELAPELEVVGWHLRRLLAAPDRLALLDRWIARAPNGSPVKARLLLERSAVAGRLDRPAEERAALDDALRAAPKDLVTILALSRAATREGDRNGGTGSAELLARTLSTPEHAIAWSMEAARLHTDPVRASRSLAAAARIALGSSRSPSVTVLSLAIADACLRTSTTGAIEDLETIAALLLEETAGEDDSDRRLRASLLLRMARRFVAERPQIAWRLAQHATAVTGEDPCTLAGAIELGTVTGQASEVPHLVQLLATHDPDELHALVSGWCAELFQRPSTTRTHELSRLLEASRGALPGTLLSLASTEVELLPSVTTGPARTALAAAYVAAAHGIASGTLSGDWDPTPPDHFGAVTLLLEAAYLFGLDDTARGNERARGAVLAALDLAPTSRVAVEIEIDLDDLAADTGACATRLRQLAADDHDDTHLSRVLGIAYRHRDFETVCGLLEEALAAAPNAIDRIWELDAVRAHLGQSGDRIEALAALARTVPAERDAALRTLSALRVIVPVAERPAALDEVLLAGVTDDGLVRDSRYEILRERERWIELASERRVEAYTTEQTEVARRAWREASWVMELRFADLAHAATIYTEWRARLPEDRTALEGAARCRAALREFDAEVDVREAIMGIDDSPEASWLYARSLERAGKIDRAFAKYQEVCSKEMTSVAAVTAAVVGLELAVRRGDLTQLSVFVEHVATATTHDQLAGLLWEDLGWIRLLDRDTTGARAAWTASIARVPTLTGAHLGLALITGFEGDVVAHGEHLEEVAYATATSSELYARAAILAIAIGDPARGRTILAEATLRAPEHVESSFFDVELGGGIRVAGDGDPFTADDRLLVHGQKMAWRAGLSGGGAASIPFELERALALELAGQPTRALEVLARILDRSPGDLRPLLVMRRITRRAGDRQMLARVTHRLARTMRSRASRLQLLLEVEELLSDPAMRPDASYTRMLYSELAELDPRASERWLPLVRRRDFRDWLAALSDIVTRCPDPAVATAALVERAECLLELAIVDAASADVVALLAFAPRDPRAIELLKKLQASAPLASNPESIVELDDLGRSTLRLDRADTATSSILSNDSVSVTAEVYSAAIEITSAPRSREPTATQLTPPALDLDAVFGADRTQPHDLALDFSTMVFRDSGDDDPSSDVVVMSLDALGAESSWDEQLSDREILATELAGRSDPTEQAMVHFELARLAELANEPASARAHYQLVLAGAPDDRTALGGARRLAIQGGDLAGALGYLERELLVCSERERVPLHGMALTLAFATGDHELAARLAAEIPDERRGIRDLVIGLELALLGSSSEPIEEICQHLFTATSEPALISAIDRLAGWLTIRTHGSPTAAFTRAATTNTLEGKLAALWGAARRNDTAAVVQELLAIALELEGDDPQIATGFATTVQHRITELVHSELSATAADASQLVSRTAPRDGLAARLAAETAEDPEAASRAYARWARSRCHVAERVYAAARAAELAPDKFGRLWSMVFELDAGDDYAAARLRPFLQQAGDLPGTLELEERAAREATSELQWLRATMAVPRENTPRMLELARSGLERYPGSDVLLEVIAACGAWAELASVADEAVTLRSSPHLGLVWRAALSWDQVCDAGETTTTIRERAVVAWDRMVTAAPTAVMAHHGRVDAYRRLGDPIRLIGALEDALELMSPYEGATRALEIARLTVDDARAIDVLERVVLELDDPRHSFALAALHARANQPASVAAALETRAARVDAVRPASVEADLLRFRAAWFQRAANQHEQVARTLERTARSFPRISADLRGVQRESPRYAGAIARTLVDAEQAFGRGEDELVISWLSELRASRADDPSLLALLIGALRRHDPPRARDLAGLLANVPSSATAGARARFLELSAELLGEPCREAALADPRRIDLAIRLVNEYVADGADDRALQILDSIPIASAPTEHGALVRDALVLADRSRRPAAELARRAAEVVAALPLDWFANELLDRSLRELGANDQRVMSMRARAGLFEQPASRAALLVSVADLLVTDGWIDDAVGELRQAIAIDAGCRVALHAWYELAAAHDRSREVADVSRRLAELERSPARAADRHRESGRALERLHDFDNAIAAYERALLACPTDVESFDRLRTMLESRRAYGRLGEVLRTRIDHEVLPTRLAEIHRSLGHLLGRAGNFPDALECYRTALRYAPANQALQRAITDLGSDTSDTRTRIAAIEARIPFESDLELLHWLWFRAASLYAHGDPTAALAAISRARAIRDDDIGVLELVLDTAKQAGLPQQALAACERLDAVVSTQEDRARFLYEKARLMHDLGAIDESSEIVSRAIEAAPTLPSTAAWLRATFHEPRDRPHMLALLHQLAHKIQIHLDTHPTDGEAYRRLAEVLALRDADASGEISFGAYIANEVATLLDPDPRQAMSARAHPFRAPPQPTEAALFADSRQPEARRLFVAFADALSRRAPSAVSVYGSGRRDRMRPDHPCYGAIKALTIEYGFPGADVLVSSRVPLAAAVDVGAQLTLVLGESHLIDEETACFATAGLLAIARHGLALPARMSHDELEQAGALLWSAVDDSLADSVVSRDVVRLRKALGTSLTAVRASVAGARPFAAGPFTLDLRIAMGRAGLSAARTVRPLLASERGDVSVAIGTTVTRGVLRHTLA